MDDKHRHKKNLTTWVSQVQHEAWDTIRCKESANPNNPIGWSEWIAQKVNLALNAVMLQLEPQTDSVETQHLQRQIAKLQDRIRELESREIGVSDTRILRTLSGEYTDFYDVVQRLIDTEAEATYETIQRLAGDGEIECDQDGVRWRLKQ